MPTIQNLKDYKFIIGIIVSTLGLLGYNPAEFHRYVLEYDVHTLIVIAIVVLYFCKGLSRVSAHAEIERAKIIKNMETMRVINNILELTRTHDNHDKITNKHEIRYIHRVETDRIRLNINSFNEDAMADLLAKTK